MYISPFEKSQWNSKNFVKNKKLIIGNDNKSEQSHISTMSSSNEIVANPSKTLTINSSASNEKIQTVINDDCIKCMKLIPEMS